MSTPIDDVAKRAKRSMEKAVEKAEKDWLLFQATIAEHEAKNGKPVLTKEAIDTNTTKPTVNR